MLIAILACGPQSCLRDGIASIDNFICENFFVKRTPIRIYTASIARISISGSVFLGSGSVVALEDRVDAYLQTKTGEKDSQRCGRHMAPP